MFGYIGLDLFLKNDDGRRARERNTLTVPLSPLVQVRGSPGPGRRALSNEIIEKATQLGLMD